MIRVLVADDEKKVCNLICQLIDWQALNMTLIGTAANGLEALELIRTKKPHLVITDIRMPGCSGLELVEKAKALSPDTQFIIISGYSQFEYAQTAIRFGVSDYIVKPIKKDVLNLTLKKVSGRFEKIEQENLSLQKLLEKQAEDHARLRNLLWSAILEGNISEDLEEINGTYHFQFEPGLFRTFSIVADVLRLNELNEPYAADVLKILFDNAVFALRKHLDPHCIEMQPFLINNQIYGILNYTPEKEQDILDALGHFIYEFSAENHILEHMKFHLALSEHVDNFAALSSCINQVALALGQRLFAKDNVLLTQIPDCSSYDKDSIYKPYNASLKQAVELKDIEILDEAIKALKDETANFDLCGSQYIDIIKDCYHLFLISHNFNSDFVFGDIEEMETDFNNKLNLCSTTNMLFDYLSDKCRSDMELSKTNADQDRIRPINQAKKYIQDNFAKGLTLEEVSGVAGFSPSYFSTIFRKETGENFSDYLMHIRVEHAKSLLRDSRIRIKDICSQVGYYDYKRFTKKFKELTGVSPKEYRDLYS